MKVVMDVSMILFMLLHDREALRKLSELISAFEAPHLYRSECANALLQYIKHNKLTPEVSLQYWTMAQDFITDFHTIDSGLMEIVFDLSIKHNISSYDAQYLAIAKANGIQLLTRDKKLAKASKSEGLLFEIEIL